MLNLILLLAQATPIVAAPPVTIISEGTLNDPRGAMPITNPGQWVLPSDYPAAALRANEQGSTAFKLAIDSSGAVRQCQITGSSGSSTLDEATCRLIRQRANFKPATDAQNNPIEGNYSNRVRWVLPKVAPPEPGTAVTNFVVEADGSVTDCRVELTGGAATQLRMFNNICSSTRKMQPYLDKDGNPERRRVEMTMAIVATPIPE